MELMNLNVSAIRADERPVRFRLVGREYFVKAVPDQWYDPESIFYKVRADDGNLYILRQQTSKPMARGIWFPFGRQERNADASESHVRFPMELQCGVP
jgi:hypothetical protein